MVVASKFHCNAIITGSVDAFCLACESYLKYEADAIAHIDKPVHKKNLDAVMYLEKFEDDHIRKIKKGYFCEFCNILLATATRVKLHVTESGHKENRGIQLLRRVGNTVIAFNSIVLKDSSWHGLMENTCIICNTEFDNEEIHKNEREHILNLVQNKVQFDDENNVFRKIDDTSLHCVICNTVLASDKATAHFTSDDHKALHVASCELYSNQIKVNDNNNSSCNKNCNQKQVPNVIENEKSNDCNAVSQTEKTVAKTVENSDEKPAENLPETPAKILAKTPVENPLENPAVQKSELATVPLNISNNSPSIKKEKSYADSLKKPTEALTLQNTNPVIQKEITVSEVKKPVRKVIGATPLQKNAYYCKTLGATNYILDEENGTSLCILCGWKLMSNWDIAHHLNGKHHSVMLKMHKERLAQMSRDMIHQQDDIVEPNPTLEPKPIAVDEVKCNKIENGKSKILDSLQELQRNRIKVDLITESAFCLMCLENIEFNYDTMESHIQEHKKANKETKETTKQEPQPVIESGKKNKTENTSLFSKPVHINRKNDELKSETRSSSASSRTSKDDENIEEFALRNNLTINNFKNYAVCDTCDIQLSLSYESMKQHVTGAKHRNKLPKQKSTKALLLKKPLCNFIDTIAQVQSILTCDVVINDNVCVTRDSFLMFKEILDRVFCLACQMFFNDIDEVNEHKNSAEHRLKLEQSDVVTNFEAEFIRMVSTDLYHCGHCNIVVDEKDDLEAHLQSVEHNECKRADQWRLQMHLPDIKQDRESRSMAYILSLPNMNY